MRDPGRLVGISFGPCLEATSPSEGFMRLILTIASLVASADDNPERLPGSDISVAKAGALYIIEAKILDLGQRRENDDLGYVYPRLTIEPLRGIKGQFRGGFMAAWQVGLLLTKNDTVPKEGEAYVLYIRAANRGLHVFKVTRRDGAIPARMPGSAKSVADAEKEALYVVETKILQLNEIQVDPGRPRGLVYPRVLIDPSKVIKGTDKRAASAVREVRLPLAEDEADLQQGEAYTLYIRKADQGFEVFRATRRSKDTPARLPGNAVSVAEAERHALYVVEARILRLGELQEDRSRPHGLVYPQVAIEPSKVIKERHEGMARSKRDVRLFLTEDETIPNEGETYTLYIRGKDRGFEVFKVTRRSDETPQG
jgi:hypothetical protein